MRQCRPIFASIAAALLAAGLFSTNASAQPVPDEPAADASARDTRVYALIVANNTSVDAGVEPLKFADDDGARYYELFDSLTDKARLLTTLDADSQKVFPNVVAHTKAPTRAHLKQAVRELAAQVRADHDDGVQSEVYLVFTGHGNVDEDGQGYLSLRDGKLHRKELFRDVVRGIKADYTHLIIDACQSYFMVAARGGNEHDWKDDSAQQSLDGELDAYLSKRNDAEFHRGSTVGVIVSTSGTAEVHEWSRFRAGVFSHQLRSALLGAADVDQDGQITYAEIEAYLVSANAGVANPRARINVYADPPEQNRSRRLVALADYKDATILQIPRKIGGRFYVEDARGLRYADFNVSASMATDIVLLHDPVDGRHYFLNTGDQQASVPLDTAQVRSTELAFAAQAGQPRGAVDEAFRTGLFSVAYGGGFYRGFVAGRDKYDTRAARRAPAAAKDWRVELGAGYALSNSLQDAPGVQHNLRLRAAFRHRSGWAVGPFVGYGYSPQSILPDAPVHRLAVGAEGSRRFALGASSYLEPRLRTGYQFFAAPTEAGRTHADPVGLRAEAALAFGWQVAGGWQLTFEPGVSLDVVTETSPDAVAEQTYWQPYAGVGLAF